MNRWKYELQQRANVRLMRRALKALQVNDAERAIQIGDRLINRRFSGGFEAKARGLYMNGQTDEAIAVLEEGVKKFPGVYILWSYLGEFCSNSGRYRDALAAFHQCEMVGDDPSYARLNIAIVYARMEDPETALQFLEGLEPRDADNERTILTVRAWSSLLQENWELSLEQSSEGVRRFADDMFFVSYEAYALMKLGQTQLALKRAWDVVEANESLAYSLDVIREIGGQKAEGSKRFKLTVSGEMEVPQRKKGTIRLPFLRIYWVQALTRDQALEYVRPFEKESVIPLKIEKADELEEVSEGYDGVYAFHEAYIGSAEMVPWHVRRKLIRLR